MIIYHVIPTLVVGGAQTALRTLIENLPQHDHRIWTLSEDIDKSWEYFDVTLISLIQLLKNLISKEYDEVIFHYHWFPPFSFRIPEKRRHCSIVTIQDNHPCTIEGAALYVVSTAKGMEYIPVNSRENARIIPPGINTSKWKNLNIPRRKGILTRHSTIYPGKLSSSMIKDMGTYNSERFSWEVIGVGEQNYVDSLRGECKVLPSVKISSYEEIYPRLNEAWLYVYHAPEDYEHFGLCFLEAMACGIPVITNDIIGGKAQIKNGLYGYVCKDFEEMKSKVEYLYDNPEIYLAMLKNIAAIDFEKMTDEYVHSFSSLYEELQESKIFAKVN